MTAPKTVNKTAIWLIAAAGVVMMVTALATESQFSAILAIGLLVGAFSMWFQTRLAQKPSILKRRDDRGDRVG